MTEKRYCIVCGKEILSDDPNVVICHRHGKSSESEYPQKQVDETHWEVEEVKPASQSITDVTKPWTPGHTLLDTYEVIGKLGKGGMGLVYKVHHKSWNLDLAVKQPLSSRYKSQKDRENFIKEAETWVDLGLYPHITTCFYVRTIQDIPHIFIEFMAGGSLEDWIQRKYEYDLYAGTTEEALSRILDIAIQFAWGLAYAHDRGLIHQDVKPLNILMTSDGIVKVTDFGLAEETAKAKAADQRGSSQNKLVKARGGSPPWWSPEQANRQDLSLETDIWAWAVSVLEMFTKGVRWQSGVAAPYTLESLLQTGPPDGVPEIPSDLVMLLRQCFEENPQNRPTDMSIIAAKLIEIYQSVCETSYPREKPDVTELRADSLNNKALTMLDLGRPEQAEEFLIQAVTADSQHVAATYNLGLLRWRSARATDVDVLQNLKQIQQDQPENGDVASALGWICLESGRFAEAVAYFEQVDHLGGDSDSEHGLKLAQPLAENLVGACLRTFEGHLWDVNSIAVSPDAHQVISGSVDQTLKLWDLITGECLRTFEGHINVVSSVAFSPYGKQALSGGWDWSLKLWDLATSACLRTFEGHTDKVNSIAISPDGRRGLSGSGDNTLKLWDLATGKCLRTFEGHTLFVNSVAISPDGRRALSGSGDKKIKLWDLATGECLRTFKGHKYDVSSVAISPDGRQALSGSEDHTLKLWDLSKGSCLRTFEGHSVRVNSVVFSPDGCFALSGSGYIFGPDKSLKLWDLAKGVCLRTFENHLDSVNSVVFSPDGRQALSGSRDHTLKLWDLTWVKKNHITAPLRYAKGLAGSEAARLERTHAVQLQRAHKMLAEGKIADALVCLEQVREVPGFEREDGTLILSASVSACVRIVGFREGWLAQTFEGHTGFVESIAISPDGRQALSGSRDHTLKLWDLKTSSCLRTFEGHTAWVCSVAISPDGRRVFSGSTDGTLKLWDLVSGRCLHTFEGHKFGVKSIAFSPDGHWAFSGSKYGISKLWDLVTGTCLRTFSRYLGFITSVAISPDGRQALSGRDDKTFKLWDLAAGECLCTYEGHTKWIIFVAFSPDGCQALSGSGDHTLKLWDLTNDKCLRTFRGHIDDVRSVAFSPDGRQALSGSMDHTLKLWDLATGECLRTFEGHTGAVNAIAFSPDGCQALSGSEDGTLKLWNLDWEYEFPGWADWDEGARPYLETFLTLHTPYAGELPEDREPTVEEIKLALTHQGKPTWIEDDFQRLLSELGHRGYGWLQPEGVRNKLEELAEERQ